MSQDLNPGWQDGTPFRTGIPSALEAAEKICQLLTDYADVIELFLDEDRRVYVDALNQACSDFVVNVRPPRP